MNGSPEKALDADLERYYRFQSLVYDWTRWSFLFGRQEVIRQMGRAVAPAAILEVGCGTGRNLLRLAEMFPGVQLTGCDLSDSMLKIAAKKVAGRGSHVTLRRQHYPGGGQQPAPDAILFSYILTMANPGWEADIAAAAQDLNEGGIVAAVDFHRSRWGWFRRWMGVNHVRMEGHLLPCLRQHFNPVAEIVRPAYLGLWEYFLFIGAKRAPQPQA